MNGELSGAGTTRREWDAYDLVTPTGTTLEVKSSAYVQTWTVPNAWTPN